MSLKKLKFFKFKGFGSLTNIPRSLSIRRSSSSSESKKKELGENHLDFRVDKEAVQETLDDLETTPRSPGYARSSEMYTYIGTMPRRNSNRVEKKPRTAEGQTGGRSKLGPLPPVPDSDQNEPSDKEQSLAEVAQPNKKASVVQECQSPNHLQPMLFDSKASSSNSTISSTQSSPHQNKNDQKSHVEPQFKDIQGKSNELENGEVQASEVQAFSAGQLNHIGPEIIDDKSELSDDSNLQNMDSKSEYVKVLMS